MDIRVQEPAFDAGAELAAFSANLPDMGAVVTFNGIVRADGGLTRLEIEHYPSMTERAIRGITQEACARWALGNALVLHRYGSLTPGETIMMVATAAPHRADAFAAAEFIMDYLKSRAPFWKREIAPDGTASWVTSKDADERALDRWA